MAEEQNIGVLIERGPQDWQVIQQRDGRADIALAGTVVPPRQGPAKGRVGVVHARLVEEDSGHPLLPWQPCDADGECGWSTVLRGVPAGGLYRLETTLLQPGSVIEWGMRGDMRHHLGVGDVFLIAGQSNSAGYGRDAVYDPAEKGIHLLRNSGRWDMASHPFNESTGTLHPVNREGSNPGSSPWLSFGRRLRSRLHYPIGFIQAALGGSSLAMWDRAESGELFQNAVDILRGYGHPIKGVLWYQGCSDADTEARASSYLARFARVVEDFRRELAQPELPFITVQLNRYIADVPGKSDAGWGLLREAQRQAARQLPGVAVVPTTDLPLSDPIHISSAGNLLLGERAAAAAMRLLYGLPGGYSAPDLSRAVRTGPAAAALTFAPVQGRIDLFDMPAGELPFTFADEAGPLAVTACRLSADDTLEFTLDRPLSGRCTAGLLWQRNPGHHPPVDSATHCPLLSFYGAEVAEGG